MSANGTFPVSWRYPPVHAPKSCQRMVTSLSAGYVHRFMLQNHVSEWYLPCQLAISTGSCSKIMSAGDIHRFMLQNHSANGNFPVSWRYPPVHAPMSANGIPCGDIHRFSSKIMSANGTFPVSWRYQPVHAPKSCQRMVPSLSLAISTGSCQRMVTSLSAGDIHRIMLQNHVSEW